VHEVIVDYFQGGGEWTLAVEYQGRRGPREDLSSVMTLTPEKVEPAKEDGEQFTLDPKLVDEGRNIFASVGCPYVVLADAEREHLKRYYFDLRGLPGAYAAWEAVYHHCAAQRLMQALGAYGFLGLRQGKASFLAHIPNALANLREVLDRSGLVPEMPKLLDWARTPACRSGRLTAEGVSD
jgi:hypothetical protein